MGLVSGPDSHIAPTILRSTLVIVDKINYPVDLIEVSRWIDGDNQLLLVNRLEPEAKPAKVKPVTGLEVYDEAFYKVHFNSDSVVHFLRYAHELNDLVKKRGWNLQQKFNKQYCGFKAGFFNAFGIKWVGSKSFAFFVKLSEAEVKRTGIKITKYEKLWKEGVVYIDPTKTKTVDILPLLEAAYHKLTGESAA
jgi:hypothetical protein